MLDRVLITGASSGIGAAAAQAFAEKGSQLFLTARREDLLKKVATACRDQGSPHVVCSAHDLSIPGEGAVVVRECIEKLGGVDVLACNAGYGLFGPVQDVDPESMARIWQVNYQSGFEAIHEALPHFLERGSGHILLTSSILGKRGMPYAAPYCATKFAQVALGESLWGELQDTGVGVTVICPGFTSTEFNQASERAGRARKPNRRIQGQDPKVVAKAMVGAVFNKKREIHMTKAGKALLLVDRISPSLAARIMRRLGRGERRPESPPE